LDDGLVVFRRIVEQLELKGGEREKERERERGVSEGAEGAGKTPGERGDETSQRP